MKTEPQTKVLMAQSYVEQIWHILQELKSEMKENKTEDSSKTN